MALDLCHTGFYSELCVIDFARNIFGGGGGGGGGRGGGRGGRGGGRGGGGGGGGGFLNLSNGLD